MSYVEFNSGQSRLVMLIGKYAIKLPRFSRLYRISQGRNCNKAERHAWNENIYPQLCPIVYADKYGWIVLMLRASPMSSIEFDDWFYSDDWPFIPNSESPFELKHTDAGYLPPDKRRVMIDYGMRGYQITG